MFFTPSFAIAAIALVFCLFAFRIKMLRYVAFILFVTSLYLYFDFPPAIFALTVGFGCTLLVCLAKQGA